MPLTRDRTKLDEAICQIQPLFGQPLLVTLPLECRPRRLALTAYAVGMSLFAALILFVLAVSLLDPADEWPRHVLNFLVLVPFAILFGRRGFHAWRALRVRNGALLLESEGFEDQRLQLRLTWRQIGHARIKGGAIHIAPKTSSRRLDEVVVPLAFLTPGRGVAAQIMGHMIETAGGNVDRS